MKNIILALLIVFISTVSGAQDFGEIFEDNPAYGKGCVYIGIQLGPGGFSSKHDFPNDAIFQESPHLMFGTLYKMEYGFFKKISAGIYFQHTDGGYGDAEAGDVELLDWEIYLIGSSVQYHIMHKGRLDLFAQGVLGYSLTDFEERFPDEKNTGSLHGIGWKVGPGLRFYLDPKTVFCLSLDASLTNFSQNWKSYNGDPTINSSFNTIGAECQLGFGLKF